jgi:enoyl-CoA hydratase/carnithine racemase
VPRSGLIRLSVGRGIAEIQLRNSRRSHRIEPDLVADLRAAADAASADESVRVILLHSAGPDFCAGGMDLRQTDGRPAEYQVAEAFARISQPVVVGIAGRAFDQGLELALAGDIRLASNDARFAMRQVVEGGMPFDGGTQRLPRAVGASLAYDMLLTGREISAEEALSVGLVSRLFAPDALEAGAREIALGIAARGDAAGRFAKEAILRGAEMPFEYGMRLEGDLGILLHHDPERLKAISAWKRRRRG